MIRSWCPSTLFLVSATTLIVHRLPLADWTSGADSIVAEKINLRVGASAETFDGLVIVPRSVSCRPHLQHY